MEHRPQLHRTLHLPPAAEAGKEPFVVGGEGVGAPGEGREVRSNHLPVQMRLPLDRGGIHAQQPGGGAAQVGGSPGVVFSGPASSSRRRAVQASAS